MSTSVSLPDDLAERIAAEAAKRDMTVDELAAETLKAQFQSKQHRLGFPLGASTSGRNARDAEEMLAEGFGRDSLRS